MPPNSSVLAPDLTEMLAAVRVVSTERYLLQGDPCDIEPESEASEVSPEQSTRDRALPPQLERGDADKVAPRVQHLAQALYLPLYARTTAQPSRAAGDDATRRRFVAELSAAHTGTGTWEPGWTVAGRGAEGSPKDRLAVRRGDLTFYALREQVRASEDDAGAGLAPGTRCRVWIGRELRDLLPGFYLALGDADEPEPRGGEDEGRAKRENGGSSLVRIYWHLTADGAAPFLRSLTSRLNAAGVPFRCKVLDHPTAYRRADAGVLYLDPCMDRGAWEAVWEPLEEIQREVAVHLRPQVPRCTRELAPGVAVAEDPANGLSFGQHRCQLVARSLWRAFEEGAEEPEERAAMLAAVFEEEGLDPTRPHLGPGSRADYPAFRTPEQRAEPKSSPGSSRDPRAPFSPLEAAAQIGDVLCRAAYRHDGRCNWVGRSQNELPQVGAPLVPTVAALGPALYDGTAGVGLFLARLHRATGEASHRTTALEALRQALGRVEADREEETRKLGLYTGELGVLWAAWQIGWALGEAEPEDTAKRRLVKIARTLDEGGPEHDLDVIDGSAGAIPVFLALYLETGREEPLKGALRLGEEMCAAALERDVGRAWDPHRANRRASREPGSRPWTGLSHGSAGMALALYELHAVTGEQVFLDTALAAFAWEDHLFDPERRNWIDTRYPDTPTWGTAWCHGAPGIALTRLRAAVLDPERREAHLESVRVALTTTRKTLETARTAPGADTSLCHGVAGLAGVLLLASRDLAGLNPEVDGDLDPTQLEALARETLADLFGRYGAEGPWPSGTPSLGPNPSLMLGTAGIGYTLLRLHDPEAVPSVLRLDGVAGGGNSPGPTGRGSNRPGLKPRAPKRRPSGASTHPTPSIRPTQRLQSHALRAALSSKASAAQDLVEPSDDPFDFFRCETPEAAAESGCGERPYLAYLDPGPLRQFCRPDLKREREAR